MITSPVPLNNRIHSEKRVAGCTNIIKGAYTSLDGIASCTPGLWRTPSDMQSVAGRNVAMSCMTVGNHSNSPKLRAPRVWNKDVSKEVSNH